MTKNKRVNLVVVLSESKSHVLMCLRQKDPYLGKYNFVGGKVLPQETSLEGAYRELFEETNIASSDISISPLFTTHYQDGLSLEVFTGVIKRTVDIIEEANPLEWIRLDNSFDSSDFAGDGNVQHIIACVKDLYSL